MTRPSLGQGVFAHEGSGPLREYVTERLLFLNWRHFGVGALQAYLSEGSEFEVRVHVWDEALVRKGIRGAGDIHDHRFSFRSDVLVGTIIDTVYSIQSKVLSYFDIYEVENARKAKARSGSFDGKCTRIEKGVLTGPAFSRIVRAGESYDLHRKVFHQTRFVGTTVTVLTKFDQHSSPARILVPAGKRLVHAFGGPKPDTEAVLNRAWTLLRSGT